VAGSAFLWRHATHRILLLTFLLRQADYTLAVTLFAFGHEKLISIRALVDGVVSVAIAFLLVGPFGACQAWHLGSSAERPWSPSQPILMLPDA
jgi:hypothetical protein